MILVSGTNFSQYVWNCKGSHHIDKDLILFSGTSWPAGQTVRVEIPTSLPRAVLSVPHDALILRRSSAAVFCMVGDDSAEHVEVKTGITQGEWIEVTGGIHAGDCVIARGGERLRPGQKMIVISSGSSSSSSSDDTSGSGK